jgi:hypothetical protein
MKELANRVSSNIIINPGRNANALFDGVGKVARIKERDNTVGTDRAAQRGIAATRNNYADTFDFAGVLAGRAFQISAKPVKREVGSFGLCQAENVAAGCPHNCGPNMSSSNVHSNYQVLPCLFHRYSLQDAARTPATII